MPGVLVFYSCSTGHNLTCPPSTKGVGAADYRGKKWNLVVRRLGLLPLWGGGVVSHRRGPSAGRGQLFATEEQGWQGWGTPGSATVTRRQRLAWSSWE